MLLIRGAAKRRALEEAVGTDLPVAQLMRAAGNRLMVFWTEQG